MSFPIARLTDLTVTGDPITGPGMPTVIVGGLPVSVMGDVVSGAVCIGAVTMGSPKFLVGGRPVTRVTSMVTGANAVTGVPLTTTVIKGHFTFLVP
jgi:uncharacterized Zn-binding protein involved in type VI secretion